jgi:hypothetical protein
MFRIDDVVLFSLRHGLSKYSLCRRGSRTYRTTCRPSYTCVTRVNAGSSFPRQIGIGDELLGEMQTFNTRMSVRQDLHRLELKLEFYIPTDRMAGW